jgi:methionine sulfoxide reductase catalytic subunit
MLLRSVKAPENRIAPSEITPRDLYFDRRRFLAGAAALGVFGALPFADGARAAKLDFKTTDFGKDEKLTPLKDVTTYNNYYEFGSSLAVPNS